METERPSLNFYEVETGRHIQVFFGYMSNVPTAAIFADGENTPPVLIERDVLQTMVDEGWGDSE